MSKHTPKARLVIVGGIEVVGQDEDNFKHDLAMVLTFENREDIRKAMDDGKCEFTFGEQP